MIRFILGREPVLVAGFVTALLQLGVAFGLDVDAKQVAAVGAVVLAGMMLLARRQVVPTEKVKEAIDEVTGTSVLPIPRGVLDQVVGGLLGGKRSVL